MEVLSVGLTAFYIFNSQRYSYRAAFVRDEMQLKGAGSVLLGTFLYYDDSQTEAGFIPMEFPDSIRSDFDLNQINSLAVCVSVGYAYNFVLRQAMILGRAAIPGFGYQRVDIRELNDNEGIDYQRVGLMLIKGSIGYDTGKLYFSTQGSVNFRNVS